MSLVVKAARKYQTTLPKEVRETLGIRISGPLRIRVEDERIILGAPHLEEEGSPRRHAQPRI